VVVHSRGDEHCSADFVHERLANGWGFQATDIFEEMARHCAVQLMGPTIAGEGMSPFLDQLAPAHCLPAMLAEDNSPEVTVRRFLW
jgi:hypothetical protein